MRGLQGSQKLVLISEIAGARSSERWRASQRLSQRRHVRFIPALLPHVEQIIITQGWPTVPCYGMGCRGWPEQRLGPEIWEIFQGVVLF